jgi:methyl-accepting chemotaxis protein
MRRNRLSKGRRKKYYLHRSAQPRLLLGTATLFLVLVIIAGGLFYLLADKELSAEYFRAHSTLRHVMGNLLPWLVLVNLLGLAVALFLAIFHTHRIAGPAYRIQQDLRRIGRGVLTTEVRTRKRDQLKGLESEINEMTAELRRVLEEVKERLSELANHVEELERAVESRPLADSQLHELLEKIKSCQEGASRRLSFFQTR